MVKGVAHPRIAQSVRRQPDIILDPNPLVLQGIDFPQLTSQIPGQGVNLTPFLDVFYDDGEITLSADERFQSYVDAGQPVEKVPVIFDIT